MDLMREVSLRKIEEHRARILSTIESYVLRHADALDLLGQDGHSRDAFLRLLHVQHQLRSKLAGTQCRSIEADSRLILWSAKKCSRLLSLLSDLQRQMQPLLVLDQPPEAPTDMLCGFGSLVHDNFGTLCRIYEVVFTLR